jgi:hypothetical protein
VRTTMKFALVGMALSDVASQRLLKSGEP